ncbi:MAG: heliorhodopsin HeR [Bacilli bacterium]
MENIVDKNDKLYFESLIRFNKIMGSVHLIQGLLMMVFAIFIYPNLDIMGTGPRTFTIPVVGNYLEFVEGQGLVLTTTDTLFKLPFLPLVACFLLLSALFHFIIAYPYKDKYVEDLKQGINKMRWYEYALSSSLMIVLISSLFGVRDVAVFVLIALANAAMNLFGLDMELINSGIDKSKNKTNWLPFIFGSVIGIAPWLAIAFYIGVNPDLSQVPGFVWAILITYFLAFNTFPVNMFLQYKGVGKFKNYLYGERGYIILSLVAKTILTWLVLFGAFQP